MTTRIAAANLVLRAKLEEPVEALDGSVLVRAAGRNGVAALVDAAVLVLKSRWWGMCVVG